MDPDEHPIPAAMDPETEPEPEHVETEPEQPEPRRRRGPTTGQTYRNKVKDPHRRIEFGTDGNLCGTSSGSFANYVGQVARDHVPINFVDWKKVPVEPIKNNCWEKIKVKISLKSQIKKWKLH